MDKLLLFKYALSLCYIVFVYQRHILSYIGSVADIHIEGPKNEKANIPKHSVYTLYVINVIPPVNTI